MMETEESGLRLTAVNCDGKTPLQQVCLEERELSLEQQLQFAIRQPELVHAGRVADRAFLESLFGVYPGFCGQQKMRLGRPQYLVKKLVRWKGQ